MHFSLFLWAELQSSTSLCNQLCLHQMSYSVLPSASSNVNGSKGSWYLHVVFSFCYLSFLSFLSSFPLPLLPDLFPIYWSELCFSPSKVSQPVCIAPFQQCVYSHVPSDFPFHVSPLPRLLHLTCPSATALFKHYLNLQFLWNMTEMKTEVSSCSEEDKANYLL